MKRRGSDKSYARVVEWIHAVWCKLPVPTRLVISEYRLTPRGRALCMTCFHEASGIPYGLITGPINSRGPAPPTVLLIRAEDSSEFPFEVRCVTCATCIEFIHKSQVRPLLRRLEGAKP